MDPYVLFDLMNWIRATLESSLLSLPPRARACDAAALAQLGSFQ